MDQSDRRRWVEYFQQSGLTQQEFEEKYNISARTLRSWKRQFHATRQPPAETVRETVEQAIAALSAVRDRLDSACREAERSSPVDAGAVDHATSSSEQPGDVGSSPGDLLCQVLPGAIGGTVRRDEPAPGPASPPEVSAAPAAAGKLRRRGFFSDLV